ncbi:hypothetical protein [Fodinicola feengrottensis]|uniref:hypothetical protein n=1 Tax=Fodinicola feengrottensis TaxID=435914 RepID=UPI0013D0BF46|nr:hypothetical protein [Fodinicola feengrottensis]
MTLSERWQAAGADIGLMELAKIRPFGSGGSWSAVPMGEGDRLPLSVAQFGLWYGQLSDPTNPTYNCAHYVHIEGRLDERLSSRPPCGWRSPKPTR